MYALMSSAELEAILERDHRYRLLTDEQYDRICEILNNREDRAMLALDNQV